MKPPLVSIIIPAYNSEHFLIETVNSALGQSYKNIEIILVDDGSTDKTTNLFDRFQKQGVQCFSIENGGASNARNFGLSKSRGTYIQFLDADDIIHSEKIEKQISTMQNENADISFTLWANFTDQINSKTSPKFAGLPYCKTRTGKEQMFSFGMDNWFILVHSWLTHADVIKKAGNWNINISNNDDGEYFSRVLYASKKVLCINEVLAYYRISTMESLGKMNSINKVKSGFESINLIKKLLEKDPQSKLLTYPKRLYYKQFKMTRKDFPEFSKNFAKEFDRIKEDCFLSKHKKYWFLIQWFGLYKGQIIYSYLINITKGLRSVVK